MKSLICRKGLPQLKRNLFKKVNAIIFMFFLFTPLALAEFISTWDTTKEGISADNQSIQGFESDGGGNIIVGFKSKLMTASQRNKIHSAMNTRPLRSYRLIPVDVVELPPGKSQESMINAYKNMPQVKYAEPNYKVHLFQEEPNDPMFEDLCGMHNTGQSGGTTGADISMPEAWAKITGSREIIVAVIDTGIDYNHEDLADNMWVNPEPTFNDIHGARWTEGDGSVTSGDPFDDNSHGTHVAGTIGAVGNNETGVTGVSWNVSLMALKIFPSSGSGSIADAIAAIEYAVEKGAHLSNNSWGWQGGFSQALKDAVAVADEAGQLFVAAAGNNSKNNDSEPFYPASYDLPNVISVAASNHNDERASFSNWGKTTVHLAAPGRDILSTIPGDGYGWKSGTSMAAPHVAGAAALILSVRPYIDVKQKLIDSVTALNRWDELVISGGRLNVAKAVLSIYDDPYVETHPAEEVGISSAKFHGELKEMGLQEGVTTYFEYRVEGGEWKHTTEKYFTQPTLLESLVEGLESHTNYQFRAVASWDADEFAGNILDLITEAKPAEIEVSGLTASADKIYLNEEANFSLSVENLGDEESSYTSEFYINDSTVLSEEVLVSGNSIKPVSVTYSTDSTGTYIITAKDTDEEKTLAVYDYPFVETNPAVDVGISSATIQGELKEIGFEEEFSVYFRYRLKGSNKWIQTPKQYITEPQSFNFNMESLYFNAEYEFKAIVEWDDQETEGGVKYFKTNLPEEGFEVSDLQVSPSEIYVREEAVFSVDVYNNSSLKGSYNAEFYLNDSILEDTLYIPGKSAATASLIYSTTTPGEYTVGAKDTDEKASLNVKALLLTMDVVEKSTSSAQLKGKLLSFAEYSRVKVYFISSGDDFSITTIKTDALWTGEFVEKISGLEPDSTYSYKFLGDFSVGESTVNVKGDELLFVTYQLPPQKVTEGDPDYEDYLPESEKTAVTIKWKGRTGHRYRIERGGVFISSATASSIVTYTDSPLRPDTEYLYRVFSLNSAGEYDEDEYIEIRARTIEAEEYKPKRRFITPSKREIEFGLLAEEVVITCPRGVEVARLSDYPIVFNAERDVMGELESGVYLYRIITNSGDTRYGTIAVVK